MPRHALTPLLVVLVGCGDGAASGGDGGGAANETSAVVAVSFDTPLEGRVDRVEIDVKSGTDPLVNETFDTDGATPIELALPTLDAGTRLQIRVVAHDADLELIHQVVLTEVEKARTLLVPVRMNDECIVAQAHRDVSCAGSTCRQGVCQSPWIEPDDLDDYHEAWATPPEGSCGTVDTGEPTVTIGGEGETFEALTEGRALRPYLGLQGGMHFFLAVEASGVDGETAITHYFDKILSTGRESSVLSVEKPYQVDGGCHRYNLAYVLPPIDVVGETMRLGVNVADDTGNTGHGHVDIVVGDPIGLER